MYDIIIIGGGPAASAAAFYALEKRLNVVMVVETLGGKVGMRTSLAALDQDSFALNAARQHVMGADELPKQTHSLPAHQLVRLIVSHSVHAGCMLQDRVTSITPGLTSFDVETQNHGVLQGTAVIVATGATPLLLNVPGAERLIDGSTSYSITTYAQQVAGQHVAVIGDTRRALLGVAELAQTAEQVYLIAPRADRLTTPLAFALRDQYNVAVFADAEVLEVAGTTGIESLVVRARGQTHRLLVQRAFVDLGLVPNSELVRGLAQTDERGFIIVDRDNATNVPGLFAAGDVTTTSGEQVLVAIGDGGRAAMNAYTFVLTRALEREKSLAVGC